MNERIETKYILNKKSFNFLKLHLGTIMVPDKFSYVDGYLVSSLYFDDAKLKAYYDKEEGELIKEKWRLRIYNNDHSTLRLERKIKKGQISDKQIFSPLHYHGFQPKICVNYLRLAFIENDLRVTLDSNLSYSKARLVSDLESEQRNEYDSALMLLEVKSKIGSDHPHLNQIIQNLGLKSSSFSKYNEGMKHLYDL
jgi:SPX domain protein involved in polyphosphate accumulation